MSGRIPRHFIDDLLVRVDIVDLIDRHVPLKKAGANYIARCPFHTEKTPSFSVNRNKQFFHCFGCGASGNAISFLMDFSHLDFVEAIEDLATFAGVDVPRESGVFQNVSESKSASINSYQLLEQAAAFYADILTNSHIGKKAADYLQARGVRDDTAQTFMLGFAPDGWHTLTSKFDQAALIDAGMSVNKDGKVYDRFRNRLMFPIRDKRGRVIGFGGRVMDDSLPKYLNSPETSIFHKGREVYGLYELLQKNSKPDRILVVEGYMDVIALTSHGIDYAVATLGTATSKEHMDLLFRFTSELVFCFDGDGAGQKASRRAISSVFPSLREGRRIRIMVLPEDHDPDSMIAEEGLALFTERINASQALSDYFFEDLTTDLKLAERENLSYLIDEAKKYLLQLPIGTFRELMFEELSKLTKIHISDHEAILAYERELKRHRQKTDKLSIPSFIMALLIQNPELIEIVEQHDVNWNDLDFDGIDKFRDILNFLLLKRPPHFGAVLENYRDNLDEAIIRKLASYDLKAEEANLKQVLLDSLNRLVMQTKTAMLDRLITKNNNVGLNASEKELLRKLTTIHHNGEKN